MPLAWWSTSERLATVLAFIPKRPTLASWHLEDIEAEGQFNPM